LTIAHALSCKKHGGLIWRHDKVKDVLVDLCKSARLPCEVEPRQALNGNKLRPDILIRFVRNGQDGAFDLTIHNPLRNKESMNRATKDD